MFESLLQSSDRVEDRIRLHRQGDRSPIVVVEGPADELVLQGHFEEAKFFPAGGRANVITAADALRSWGMQGYLAIVDMDYLPAPAQPVAAYDGRDLEAMLVSLGALEALINHQGSAAKVKSLGGARALVDRLVGEAQFLSALRAVNAAEGLGLPFDSTDLAKRVDSSTLKIAQREMCQALLTKAQSDFSPDELLRRALDCADDGLGPSGKDVIVIAGVALRKLAGALPHAAAHSDFLLPQLRSSAALLIRESVWLESMRYALLGEPVAA